MPVADCNQVQFQSHPKHSMLFKDFIEYWAQKNNAWTSDGTSCTLIFFFENIFFCRPVLYIASSAI